ncbi:hypothetical protein LAZ67_5002915 [Cordylochernes scorpioides]|uniref:Uncharacterized protein n=1 Tax=Cordylochernes scorpioides TaxID=51811 RepID=A0ABY6KJV9_9ARAC|nr:hypothetical protein LAZ67_5002915 [Cordylochernes scorpioides]
MEPCSFLIQSTTQSNDLGSLSGVVGTFKEAYRLQFGWRPEEVEQEDTITIIFKANGLLDIVNGKSLFEDLKDETGKDKWSLKDAKAQKYIMLTIEKNVLTHILNCKTSK